MNTLTGRVLLHCYPPGQPDTYIALTLDGIPQHQYVTGGAEATCDGVTAEGFELAEWLTHHRCDVRLTLSPDQFNAVVKAEFQSLSAGVPEVVT